MRRISTLIFLILLLPLYIFAQGVRVHGNLYPIDERSSVLIVGKKLQLKDFSKLTINFQLSLNEESSQGSICQLRFSNLDDVYSLNFRELPGDRLEFMISNDGIKKLDTLVIPKDELKTFKWIDVEMIYDLTSSTISWKIFKYNKRFSIAKRNVQRVNLDLLIFGKNDYNIDVADVAINTIKVSTSDSKIVVPLTERVGKDIHTVDGKVVGVNSKGDWLFNEAYYWKKWKTLNLASANGYQFNSSDGRLYIFTRDSLTVIDIYTGDETIHNFSNPLELNIQLGNSFIYNQALYIYEINNLPLGDCSMVKVDLKTYEVSCVCRQQIQMQLHHHTGVQTGEEYYIYGGFGNDKYSNKIIRYDLNQNIWDTVSVKGDPIIPRYFTSSFVDETTKNIYFFGGMGNVAGDHMVGRNYYYDLYRFEPAKNELRKIWSLDWKEKNKIPVKNLVRIDGNSYYTLMYPEYMSESHIYLYKFDVKTANYIQLGDSIPIRSDKIRTNANLFYSEHLQQFYAVTNVFDSLEQRSLLNIYSLRSPAISKEMLLETKYTNEWKKYLLIGGSLILCAIGVLYGYRFIQKPKVTLANEDSKANLEFQKFKMLDRLSYEFPAKNCIYFFGEFKVIDKKGDNISHLFNGKIKQLFVLFFTQNIEEGLTSEYISAALWPEKDYSQSKNIRGVMINNLRKILDHFDGICLKYENGRYIMAVDSVYIDYIRFLRLIKQPKEDLELVDIIYRGTFLKRLEDELFDELKSNVELSSIAYLNNLMLQYYNHGQYENAIWFARLLFKLDPLSQSALIIEINSLLNLQYAIESRKRYNKFIKRYEDNMAKSFDITYENIRDRRIS